MSEDIDPWLEHHDPVSGRITYTRKNPPKPAPQPKPVDPKPVLTPHDQLVIHTAQVMIDRQVAAFGRITNPPDLALLDRFSDYHLQYICDHHPYLDFPRIP